MTQRIIPTLAAIGLAAVLIAHGATPATFEFQLLTWNDTDATAALPSAVGRKPSAPMPTPGDWLVFTEISTSPPARTAIPAPRTSMRRSTTNRNPASSSR